MTQRGKLISRSRKWASQHDPEGKMISRSRKQAGQHDLEKKKWFLGQGSRQVSMTWRRKKDF